MQLLQSELQLLTVIFLYPSGFRKTSQFSNDRKTDLGSHPERRPKRNQVCTVCHIHQPCFMFTSQSCDRHKKQSGITVSRILS